MKNNKELLEYISLPDFSREFRNRDIIRGGGVGAYIRDTLSYKRRIDIENIQPEFEHLWLEVPGKNKHSKLFWVLFTGLRLCTSPQCGWKNLKIY